MKKIMILGASATQVPLIKCAKNMGLYTCVASIPGKYPGFQVADKVLFENTTDKEAILNVCRQEGVDGICTTGTDVAVQSIGYVNSMLGLTGITYESSQLVTDKAEMKKAMWNGGVKTAEFFIAYSLKEVYTYAAKIGYPVMVKTVDQAASKGISKVENETEIEKAYLSALKWTKKKYVIVEKCLSGKEIGLDGYVNKNGDCTIFLHNKITFNNGQTNVPVGHSVPFATDDSDVVDAVLDVAEQCVKSVDFSSCFFNMDIMLSQDGPYILEIGGRTGSTCIPDMLSQYCKFNYYEKILENALGLDVCMECSPVGACAAGFLCGEKDGIVKAIQYPTFDESLHYEIDVRPGDVIKKFYYGSDRIGQVIVTAANAYKAEQEYFVAHQELLKGITYV